jgi:tetratricopeptide (TPR) repeat protein
MAFLENSSLRGLAALSALATLLVLPGCSKPTPEERFLKAQQSMMQNDPFGAELEFRRLVDDHPEDPVAIDARLALAAIYARDERLDDALTETKVALDQVSLNTERGMTILRRYNEILKARKRHKEGLDRIVELEKKYANEPMVLTSLLFARADLQSDAGETTAARATLSTVMGSTTDTRVLPVVRRMTVQTYLTEDNTTGAIERVQQDYKVAGTPEEQLNLVGELASLYFIANDYENLRRMLEEATQLSDKSIVSELDRNRRIQIASNAFQIYQQVGNVQGAREILEASLDGASIPESAQIVPTLAQVYIREGRTSDAIQALRVAGQKLAQVPNSPAQAFLSQADLIQNLSESNKLPGPDTAPLTLRFKTDTPIGLSTLDLLRNPSAPSNTTTGPLTSSSAAATTTTP